MNAIAEVLAAHCTFTYVEGYGDCLTFSGDADELAEILAAAGFGPVKEAVEVTEAQWQEAAEMADPVVVARPYTEADLQQAKAEAWDEGRLSGSGPSVVSALIRPNPYRAAAVRGEG